jgi:hypothetical protein
VGVGVGFGVGVTLGVEDFFDFDFGGHGLYGGYSGYSGFLLVVGFWLDFGGITAEDLGGSGTGVDGPCPSHETVKDGGPNEI